MLTTHPRRTIGQPPRTNRQRSRSSAAAFTLVEVLVVIAIIGILLAIAVPAVGVARRTVLNGFIKAECATFDQGIEAYRLKYGDYPPDFSDFNLARRHYKKIFPDILTSELTLLQNMISSGGTLQPSLINPAEALVFAVGGFSSNQQQPFTGSGGPFALITGATPGSVIAADYQYNSARENGLRELPLENLSIAGPSANAAISATNRTESSDDGDLFPVFSFREDQAPFVYFDSRTYRTIGTDLVTQSGNTEVNAFFSVPLNTGITPVVSEQLDGAITPTGTGGSYANFNPGGTTTGDFRDDYSAEALRQWKFANDQTFQVLSPGLDGLYGLAVTVDPDGLPLYWQYPSGSLLVPSNTATTPAGLIRSEVSSYNESSWSVLDTTDNFAKDNVANFTEQTFEDDLP